MSDNKDSIIRSIYYDADDGFDSIIGTYRKANKVLNTITVADVKAFIEKQKGSYKQTKPYRGFNSYVAPKALHELQVDLAVFTDSSKDNDGYKYAFVAIDIFSKYIWAVPIKDKKPQESIRAFTEVLDKIGIPQQIMSDREGAWESTEFVKLLNKHNIKHIISTSPPPFSERAVQEIKKMIHTRLEGLELNKEKWVELLPSVLKKYNSRVHGTTGLSPNDARDDKNNIEVWLNIKQKAQYKRSYPPLSVGSSVRTYIKPHTFKKGYTSSWSKDVYKVTFIKDNQYLVNDNKRKVYNRWELLKIDGAEGKD
jgi:hypothetical protein